MFVLAFSKISFLFIVIPKLIQIRFSEPNVATIVGTDKVGKWTMVYDEGFEVKIDGEIVCLPQNFCV